MFFTVEFERGGCPDGGTQPAVVIASVLHPQVPDDQDPLASVRLLFIATSLWELLVPSIPGNLSAGLRHFADHLHGVRLCSLHVGQVLCKPGCLL